MDQKPNKKPGESEVPTRGNQNPMRGIGPENFDSVFLLHRHDGTSMGGGNLYGPYFIRDANGANWKLVVSTTGAISAVKA